MVSGVARDREAHLKRQPVVAPVVNDASEGIPVALDVSVVAPAGQAWDARVSSYT